MKRIISIAAMALLLGSCQSDNTPTQSGAADEQVGVSARLFATSALPNAQRFRARLTVGDMVGEWVDAPYAKDAELNLGKVKRGTLVVLDVRGYTMSGTDFIWKWFAHKSDSAKGAVLTIDAEVKGIVAPAIVAGQVGTFPVGSWYTTDSSSWDNKSLVDSTGTIPALSGTTLRVRLAVVVGDKEVLLGDTLRLKLPQKPSIVPANRTLNVTDSVRVNGASGDSLSYCEGTDCNNWAPYKKALAPKAIVLRARAVRNGLVSPIETATFTLVPTDTTSVVPVDTVIEEPTFSLPAGIIGAKDKITISSVKAGDSIRYSTGGNWNGYTDAIMAGTFTLRAVSLRGKYVSDTAEATYVASSTKPSSPTITSSCTETSKCDPGTTVEMTADSGVKLLYAFSPDSTDWKSYTKKLTLDTTTKVFGRAVRGSDTSAAQSTTFTVVQPAEVKFAISRRKSDTVWVKPSTTSGKIHYRRGAAKDSTEYKDTSSIPVRVRDSIFAWTWRGTARSAETKFVAAAEVAIPDTVKAPSISPNPGALSPSDSIRITPAKQGDSIRYSTDGKIWFGYTKAFKAGDFTVSAFSLRGSLTSDTVFVTYTVKTSLPSSPKIAASTCLTNSNCDPGTKVAITTTDTGVVTLKYALSPDSSTWNSYGKEITLSKTTKVFARAFRGGDSSGLQTAIISIVQPDTVGFAVLKRTPDTIWVKLSTTSGAIRYSRGLVKDSLDYTDTIAVRVFDSLTAWSARGTVKSAVTKFHAVAVKPVKPTISSPTDSIIAVKDSIVLTTVTEGDTLQYKVGSGSWLEYKVKLAPGSGGLFKIAARSKRNGLLSDSVTRTFYVDTAKLASPTIWPVNTTKLDPGTEFIISVGSGSILQCSTSTKGWDSVASTFKFKASKDTTIVARAKTEKKVSDIKTFAITFQQPGTVTFTVKEKYLDSVHLLITPVVGDTVVYFWNDDTSSTKAATSTAITITVRANDSITAWTKRGTAYGDTSGYKMAPDAPKAPKVSPNGGHVHDTTDIRLTPATTGDDVSYKLGSNGSWTAYEQVFDLPKGDVELFVRATRNGIAKDTSIRFFVHALPQKPGITGCLANCNPGTELTFTSSRDYDIYVVINNGTPVQRYNLYNQAITATNTKVCAYTDSFGYRSVESCVTVTIKSPVAPTIEGVRLVRTDEYDSAYVTVKATQVGDQLMSRYGATDLTPVSVSTSPFTTTYGIDRASNDSVLRVWTKRGTDSAASVSYTLSKLPPPKANFAAGEYVVGKTFTFVQDLASGALSSDTIYLSTDYGSSWNKSNTVKLDASTQVWARTKRKGYGNTTDSSAVFKVLYTLDSLIVSSINLVLGAGTAEEKKSNFDMALSVADHKMLVPDHITSLGVEFVVKGDPNDVSTYRVRCDNCSDTGYYAMTGTTRSVNLNKMGLNYFTFRVTTTAGLVNLYRIAVHRTAPWNDVVVYGKIVDDHGATVEEYKTVTINGKTWMAENLRYHNTGNGTGETCYDNDTINCREYGRLYTWAQAMGVNREGDTSDYSFIPLQHDGICPFGFRMPNFEDWKSLAEAAGTTNLVTLSSQGAHSKLRAESAEWSTASWTSASDNLGFRALPAGYQDATGAFKRLGLDTQWWMANQTDVAPATDAFVYQLYGESVPQGSYANRAAQAKLTKLSVRCVEK